MILLRVTVIAPDLHIAVTVFNLVVPTIEVTDQDDMCLFDYG